MERQVKRSVWRDPKNATRRPTEAMLQAWYERAEQSLTTGSAGLKSWTTQQVVGPQAIIDMVCEIRELREMIDHV